MSAARLVLVVTGYRALTLRRYLAASFFPIFVLGPLIVGAGLWIAERYLYLVREPLAAVVASDATPGVTAFALALLLTVLALPAVEREIFPHRSADACLDALPVPEAARFHVALAAGWVRQLPACAVLLVALVALSETRVGLATLGSWTLTLLGAFVPLTLLAMAASQARVRCGTLRAGGYRLLAALAAGAGGLGFLAPADRWLVLLPWRGVAVELRTVLGEALAVPASVSAARGLAELAATALAAYLVSGWLFTRFRRRDLERAAALAWRSRSAREARTLPRLAAGLRRLPVARGGPAVAAQLGRDLLLVGRRFSPAVYLAAGLALVIVAAVFLVLPGLGFGGLWTRRLAVLGVAAAVVSLVALVPLLLKHQLPRLWLEKTSAVPPQEVWRAKLWLARLLAAPAAVLGGALLWTLPGGAEPGLGVALLQLLAASWIVASMVGYAAFEIAAQPVLGLLFSSLVGLALAALFVFVPEVWWMWGALYLYLAGKLAARATGRVGWTEVEP